MIYAVQIVATSSDFMQSSGPKLMTNEPASYSGRAIGVESSHACQQIP